VKWTDDERALRNRVSADVRTEIETAVKALHPQPYKPENIVKAVHAEIIFETPMTSLAALYFLNGPATAVNHKLGRATDAPTTPRTATSAPAQNAIGPDAKPQQAPAPWTGLRADPAKLPLTAVPTQWDQPLNKIWKGNIIAAGLSGVIAGAISMGIGAYISSKSEIEHYQSEIKKEEQEIEQVPEIEKEEARQIYQKKAAFTDNEVDMIVNRIASDKKTLLDTMKKEELGLFEERFEQPVKVGVIMFAAFVAGGIIPVTPFLLIQQSISSLIVSIALTFTSLFIIGVWKTTLTDRNWLTSGLEMVGIGSLATVIPYIIGDVLLTQILTNIVK